MITDNLLIPIFGGIIFFLFINLIRKSHFSIERSFLWIFAGTAILLITIVPDIVDNFSKWLGIYYPPSVLFLCSILFSLCILFINSYTC